MTTVETHHWIPSRGTPFTRGVAFKFCSVCDREEWENGVVRPGPDESLCVFNPEEPAVRDPDHRPVHPRPQSSWFSGTGCAAGLIIVLLAVIFFGGLIWIARTIVQGAMGVGC